MRDKSIGQTGITGVTGEYVNFSSYDASAALIARPRSTRRGRSA